MALLLLTLGETPTRCFEPETEALAVQPCRPDNMLCVRMKPMEASQSEKLINQCHAAAGVGFCSQPASCLKASTCSCLCLVP